MRGDIMEKLLKVHHLVTHLALEKKISYLVAAFFIVGMASLFCYADEMTDKQAGLFFWQLTMPAKEKIVNAEELKEYIKNDLQQMMNPIHFIYNAVPYYKSKSIALGMYDEEVAGYFGIPNEENLLSLEEENVYRPSFPTPQKEVVDTERLNDPAYLKSKIYMGGDGEITIDENLLNQWDFKALSEKPIRIDETIEGPKVLIFHTHSKEKFKGENQGNGSDAGIVAVGQALHDTLENKYGIEALHVTDSFYLNEESLDVTGAYERMEPVITSIIKQNPSIQIAIDVHRDGVKPDVHLVGDYKGQQAAKLMFVNGLCQKTNKKGEIVNMQSLTNPYIEENLAFSLQAQIEAMKYYPDLIRKIYLKPYRYSLHMLPYSLLVEVGADTNTLKEAVLAAEPIADILAKVLEKD